MLRVLRPSVLLLPVAIAVMLACSSDDVAPSLAAPVASPLVVSAEPILELGADPSDTSAQFTSIGGVAMLGNGNLLVADGRAAQISIFTPDGKLVRRFVRQGSGPGEVPSISRIALRDGEVWVAPGGVQHSPIIFDTLGTFLRTLPPIDTSAASGASQKAVPVSGADFVGALSDGSHVYLGVRMPNVETPPPVAVDSIEVFSATPDGRTAMVAHMPSVIHIGLSGGGTTIMEYSGTGMARARNELIYTAFSGDYRIDARNASGDIVRTFRRNVQPAAVSESDREQFRVRTAAIRSPSRARPQSRQDATNAALIAAMQFPERHEAFLDFLVDGDGHVWVQRLPDDPASTSRFRRFEQATQWDHFTPDGTFAGTITMPDGLRVMDISRTAVAGVWADADGVPRVRVYSISPGG